jgi:hypothetical protein
MGFISGTHEPSLADKRSGVPILLMSRTGGAPPSQRVGGSEDRDGGSFPHVAVAEMSHPAKLRSRPLEITAQGEAALCQPMCERGSF